MRPKITAVIITPNDQVRPEGLSTELYDAILKARSFFSKQMQSHGLNSTPFLIGDKVHVLRGNHLTADYTDAENVISEISDIKNASGSRDIFVVFVIGLQDIGEFWAIFHPMDAMGLCVIPTERREFIPALVCHELAHAFGLNHTDNEKTLMHPVLTTGGGGNGKIKALTQTECQILSRSIYFKGANMSANLNESIEKNLKQSDELIDKLQQAAADSKHLQQEIKDVINEYKQHVVRDLHRAVAAELGVENLYDDPVEFDDPELDSDENQEE